MDIYSIGEMVIDFIPGEEKGSYIRNAAAHRANVSDRSCKKRTGNRNVLQGWRR